MLNEKKERVRCSVILNRVKGVRTKGKLAKFMGFGLMKPCEGGRSQKGIPILRIMIEPFQN